MLIVATQDPRVRAYCQQPQSQSAAWGAVLPIDAGLTQGEAERQLIAYLSGLNPGENLCIVAHGNDEEIGDSQAGGSNWGWTYKRLARLLANNVAVTPGTVLLHTCAEDVSNFATRVVVRLEGSWQNIGHLDGVVVYGYSTAYGTAQPIPRPDQLATNVQAQPVIINV
jgi:hypothetical protein